MVFLKLLLYAWSIANLCLASIGVHWRMPEAALFCYFVSFLFWVVAGFIPWKKKK